jgi:hypothetical protein
VVVGGFWQLLVVVGDASMTLISFGALICSSSSDDVTEQF